MPKWLKKSLILIAALIIAGIWGGIAALLGIHQIIQVIVVIFIGGIAMNLMLDGKNSK